VWRSLTDAILLQQQQHAPAQIQAVLQWWCRQRPLTSESAAVTWKLWDAYQQQSFSSDYDDNSRRLLATVLDHWRWCRKQRNLTVHLDVAAVWNKLLLDEHDSWLSARSGSILLSALAFELTSSSNVEAVLQLTEDIFSHCQSLLRRQDASNNSDNENGNDSFSSSTSDTVLWNSLLTVYAKAALRAVVRGGGERAEQVLRRMQQDGVSPNAISYANVLEAVGVEGTVEAAQHAETLLQELLEQLSANPTATSTDNSTTDNSNTPQEEQANDLAHCYLQVLQAWSKSDAPDGADRGHAILQTMIRSYLESNQNIESSSFPDSTQHDSATATDTSLSTTVVVYPTHHCFSAVMTGYARRCQTERVETLLGDLQRLHDATQDARFLPTIATFNSVLEAYARQKTASAAARAQQLLERLFVLAEQSGGHARPDTTSLNTCLDAWAESGARDAAERAEAILLKAVEDEWPGVRPDAYSYTTVMKAWSRKDSFYATERCEAILRSMCERVDKQRKSAVRPNAVTYSTAIYAWSQRAVAHDRFAPLRAEALYQDMLKRNQRGQKNLKPSLSIYSSLIFAWAHSARPESDTRAQLYFDQLRGKYMAGDDTLRPNAKLYNALITSKKKRRDGPGAEEILRLMYHDYFEQKNPNAMPNRFVYHNVMAAWAKSNPQQEPLAYQRIEAILQQMQKEHETRGWDCRPNRVGFTILLSSLAKVGQKEAAERCENILRHMHALSESGDTSVKPNNYSYATVLNAWSKVTDFDEAPVRAQALFGDMLARHRAGDAELAPNKFAYTSLLSAWVNSHHPDAARNALAILNEIQDRHELDPGNNEAPESYHFNEVICALARAGDVENAERIWDRLVNPDPDRSHSSMSTRPTMETVITLITAYSKSQYPDAIERAEQLLRSAQEMTGKSPDVVTYTAYLTCWQRSGRDDAYTTGKAIVEEMAVANDAHVTPNEHTFGSLLTILRDSSLTVQEKRQEADYVEALMEHVGLRMTTDLRLIFQQVRQDQEERNHGGSS